MMVLKQVGAIPKVVATHRDLKETIRIGDFRQDLYYRLNVFQIEVPPLRADGGTRIEAQHLPLEIRENETAGESPEPDSTDRYATSSSPKTERETIVAALEEAGGIRTKAARILGMGRTTLWRKLREYGIEVEEES